MSKYDITDDMNQWEYAMYNMRQHRKDRVDALIKKYGFPIEEKNLLKEDFIEYDLLKPELEAMKAEKLAQKTTPVLLDSLKDMNNNAEGLEDGTYHLKSSQEYYKNFDYKRNRKKK